MSRPRFLADNDLNDSIVTGLVRREPSIEIVRVREVGLRRRPDSEVLQYAADGGLIVVSHDVNTMIAAAYARLAEQRAMAGLLMAKQTAPVGPIIDSLLLIWASSEAEEWHGVVEFLPL